MIVEYRSLISKPDDENGMRMYGSPVFDFSNTDVVIKSIVKVTDHTSGRPNLISHHSYNNVNYADYIMFINGIKNPFNIKSGSILFVPTIESMDEALINKKGSIKTTSSNIQKYLSSSTLRKIQDLISTKDGEIRSVNEKPTGSTTFTSADGVVTFGTDVVSNVSGSSTDSVRLRILANL